MRLLVCVCALMLATVSLAAQNPNATALNVVGWNQAAPTLADASGYVYRTYDNGSTTPAVMAGVTCAGTVSPYQCEAPFPPMSPGNHSLTLTASNIAGESGKSVPFVFTFIVTPAVPTNFGIKR